MRQAIMLGLLLVVGVPASAKSIEDPRYKPEKSADPDDRMICKRFTETGSLVNVRKVCATKKQWAISRADLRQTTGMDSCGVLGEKGHC